MHAVQPAIHQTFTLCRVDMHIAVKYNPHQKYARCLRGSRGGTTSAQMLQQSVPPKMGSGTSFGHQTDCLDCSVHLQPHHTTWLHFSYSIRATKGTPAFEQMPAAITPKCAPWPRYPHVACYLIVHVRSMCCPRAKRVPSTCKMSIPCVGATNQILETTLWSL